MISLLLLFLFLLLLSAFFSGAETALFSLSRVQIQRFRRSKGTLVHRVVECLKHPREILVTILIGNELVNVSMSIVGAYIVSRLLPMERIEEQTIVAVLIVTPIILVVGEIVPKNVALRLAKQMAPVIVVPLEVFHRLVAPLRIVLSAIANGVIRLFGGRPESIEPMVMEEEFRRLVDLGSKQGVIVEEERLLIHQVFEFTHKVVRDIMTPADELFILPIDIAYEQLLQELKAQQYSRIPIYEGDRQQILGILHLRDLFALDRRRQLSREEDIRSILHTPIFVKEDEKLEALLQQFQEHRVHMAIVVDRNQRLVGVATMHDILQELFGETEA